MLGLLMIGREIVAMPLGHQANRTAGIEQFELLSCGVGAE